MAMGPAIMATESLTELMLGTAGTFATYEAAKQAYNAVEVQTWGDEISIGTAVETTGGPAQSVSEQNMSAIEVALQNELDAKDVEISTSAIGFVQGENDTVEAVAMLGVPITTAISSIAPMLGVAVEEDLSEKSPTLYQRMVSALMPFAYDKDGNGTYVIPATAQAALSSGAVVWTVGMLEKAVNALKSLFEEEGIGAPGVEYPEYETETFPYRIESSATVLEVFNDLVSRNNWTAIPESEYTLNDVRENISSISGYVGSVYVKNGRKSYSSGGMIIAIDITALAVGDVADSSTGPGWRIEVWGGASSSGNGDISYDIDSISTRYSNFAYRPSYIGVMESADSLEGSTVGAVSYSDLPDGIVEWKGTKTTDFTRAKPFIKGIDSTTGDPITEGMIAISMVAAPEGYHPPDFGTPGGSVASNDPEIYPDTNITAEPKKQVEPYVLPFPVPWEVQAGSDQPGLYDVLANPSLANELDIELVDAIELTGSDYPVPAVPTGSSPPAPMPSTLPSFSQNVGLVTVYHPTAAQLYDFERWLWVTYADATIDKIFNNPFDGVITLFELYCTPTDIGNRTIKSGFLDSGIDSAVISRYTEIDCGTLGIPEYYGNYFDYSPYTKAHVYLPFIGIQELNPDDIVGHAVNIKYRIDEYNGSCIAMITVAKATRVNGELVTYSNLMYQFSGNCSVELPLSGGSQAAIKAGFMQADAYQHASIAGVASGVIGGIASAIMGNPAGAIGGFTSANSSYMYGKANALSNMLSGKSSVQKSGAFGSSHGALGVKQPFITITRPKQIQVPGYENQYGFPAHKMVMIGSCHGFLRCREVHVVSPTATDEEKSLIETLLKAGVYVDE